MDARLSFPGGQGGQSVGIEIAQAQQALKKQHSRGPNCRAATKPWQDLFAQQGLNLKQQKRASKNRQRKGQKTPRIGSLARSRMGHDQEVTGGYELFF
jgi:hypothetical protein